MSSGVFLTFIVTAFAVAIILVTRRLHGRISEDTSSGPQKFHGSPTPRVGGIAILIGLAVGIGLGEVSDPDFRSSAVILLLASLPAFAGGLLEDLLKRIPVISRLLFTFVSAAAAFIVLDARITGVDVPGVDWLLGLTAVSFAFTLFAIGGLAHAINIVDGFNGLAGVIALLLLAAIIYVAGQVGDETVVALSLVVAAALLGFLIFNYPRGLIFLGDGGAYLVGFLVAELAVLLVQRNTSVSPWFPLLLFGYPVWETLFSGYRRKILQGRSPGQPDGLHLHTLIHKRLLRPASRAATQSAYGANALTSPFLWLLALPAVVAAVLFWENTLALQVSLAVFIALYLVVYRQIVLFRVPSFLVLRSRGTPMHKGGAAVAVEKPEEI
jgi:UDP-N-acetylmuramyl pentapeptide phosphotransferase/UDP-N-acetylglucosamine-1-phosphate transferase